MSGSGDILANVLDIFFAPDLISNTKYGISSMGMFNKLEGCWKLGWEDLVCSTDSALFKIMLVYSTSMEVLV